MEDGRPVADIYHHKIRNPGHKPELHFDKLLLEISAAFIDDTFCLALMRVIIQSRERASMGVSKVPGAIVMMRMPLRV